MLEYMLEVLISCDIIQTDQMIHEREQGELPIDGRICRQLRTHS